MGCEERKERKGQLSLYRSCEAGEAYEEKSDALDGNVVEEEDEGGDERRRVEDSTLDGGPVEGIDDVGLTNVLRLDADLGEGALLLGKPLAGRGAVREEEPSSDTDDHANDALDLQAMHEHQNGIIETVRW